MRHKFIWLLTATVLVSATACSSEKKAADDTAKHEAAATAVPTSASKTKVTTKYGEVLLGEYKNLKGEKLIYTVTDKDIENEIEPLVEDYIEYKEVKRASKVGDYVEVELVATCDGQIISNEEDAVTSFKIGDKELGETFDQKITDVQTGDKLNFTIKYPEDYDYEELAGLTVQFRVTVNKVEEEIVPELTDAFVKKNLGYASCDEMKKQIKEDLEANNASQSEADLRESLLSQVIEASDIENYNDEYYKQCKESAEADYESIAQQFGYENVEALYEENNMTEESRKQEILDAVYRDIVVEAIAAQEGLAVTDSEYKEALKSYVEEDPEIKSEKEFLEQYSEQDIKGWLVNEKVLEFLEKNATITEKQGTLDSEE